MKNLYLIGTMTPTDQTTIEIYESEDGKERCYKSVKVLSESDFKKEKKKYFSPEICESIKDKFSIELIAEKAKKRKKRA